MSLDTAVHGATLPGERRISFPGGIAPAFLVLLIGLLIPVGIFFFYGFWQQDIFGLVKTWDLQQYSSAVGDAFFRGLIFRTLLTGLLVAMVCVPIAFFTSYVINFSLRRGRSAVLFAIVMSMLTSYLVRIYAWKLILGPRGVINGALQAIGLTDQPLDFLLFGRFAVVVTLVHILLPFAVLPIFAAMQAVDPEALRASRDLGAGPIVTLLRVTLPLTAHGVAVSFLFVFILSAGDYVTPQLVGGQGGLLIGRVIYDQFGITKNWPLASALSFTLIAGFGITVLILRGLLSLGGRAVKPSRIRSLRRPLLPARASSWLRQLPFGEIWVIGVLCFLFIPLLVVIVFSFNDSSISAFPMRGVTGRWYAEALNDSSFRHAFVTSVLLATLVSALAVAVGVPAGFALVRRRFALRGMMNLILLLPLSLPGIIIGFSILSMAVTVGAKPGFLTAALGQLTLLFPFVVLVTVARLRDFDRSVEEAGRDLGCSPAVVMRKVTLPIIAPTIIGAAILVLALSMDEFIVTLYTAGSSTTLPILVWGLMQKRGISPAVNAIATVLLLASFLVLIAGGLIVRLRERRFKLHGLARAIGREL
ncbi:MAG: ABC transporter permease subunit [Actinomycetota bacterium]